MKIDVTGPEDMLFAGASVRHSAACPEILEAGAVKALSLSLSGRGPSAWWDCVKRTLCTADGLVELGWLAIARLTLGKLRDRLKN